jgi:Mn2+/Fe2+ NRAMP family transporter
MALATVFLAYVAAGVLARPDWTAAARGLVPSMPLTQPAVYLATATLGTTLAPWGLSFIQSYAVDKKLTTADLGLERVDVVTGSVLTGVIGFFVVVASAATLHTRGVSIESAADAAGALRPVAGDLAGVLFGIGLVGAALLAASILPLSTAYSVCEFVGAEAALNDDFAQARTLYVSYVAVTATAGLLVLIPGIPLITVLILTQVLNAVLLLPLMVFMVGISRDTDLMGDHVSTRVAGWVYLVTIALVATCVVTLLVLQLVPR